MHVIETVSRQYEEIVGEIKATTEWVQERLEEVERERSLGFKTSDVEKAIEEASVRIPFYKLLLQYFILP